MKLVRVAFIQLQSTGSIICLATIHPSLPALVAIPVDFICLFSIPCETERHNCFPHGPIPRRTSSLVLHFSESLFYQVMPEQNILEDSRATEEQVLRV